VLRVSYHRASTRCGPAAEGLMTQIVAELLVAARDAAAFVSYLYHLSIVKSVLRSCYHSQCRVAVRSLGVESLVGILRSQYGSAAFSEVESCFGSLAMCFVVPLSSYLRVCLRLGFWRPFCAGVMDFANRCLRTNCEYTCPSVN
jgi:hypothetical protein